MWYNDVINTDILAKKTEIKAIAQKYGLDMVVLFGSQATGRTHAKSDVDIAVLSHNTFNLYELMRDMDGIFGRDDVTVVDLGKASPTLMYAIVMDGKLLMEILCYQNLDGNLVVARACQKESYRMVDTIMMSLSRMKTNDLQWNECGNCLTWKWSPQ